MNSRNRFLAALAGETLDAPPGWMMRQAGRYLPEYQELRSGRTFMERVRDPELAAEITLQPIRRFGMDAAVIFCDILVPPDAMGVTVEFIDGKGPVMAQPVRTAADVEALNDFDAVESTGYLAEAIRRVRAELGDERAIVGFCGAPFTTASYMIEGGSSRNFETTKKMMYDEPATFARLLERIVDNLGGYLSMQVEAGADALQIFDSWGGAFDARTYREVLGPSLNRLVEIARGTGVPVIVYCNGGGHLAEVLVETGCDCLSIDWRTDPADIRRRVGNKVALQGNLDPCILFASPDVVRRETNRVLDAYKNAEPRGGHVFNVGSGILPKTPIESVGAAFETLFERR